MKRYTYMQLMMRKNKVNCTPSLFERRQRWFRKGTSRQTITRVRSPRRRKTVSAESGLKEKLRRMTSGTNVVVCMCVRAASSTAGGCHVYSTHDRSLPTRQYWSMNDESCSYPAIYVRAIWYACTRRVHATHVKRSGGRRDHVAVTVDDVSEDG